MGPKVLPSYFQERAGVLRVSQLLNAAGLIFRETPNADVGIDGYIELVDQYGEAKGTTIAVQIKSGASYLSNEGDSWKFYPSEKHQSYWEMYPLPVILMLHNPGNDHVYWSDVRFQLRSDNRKKSPLLIPKKSLLSSDSAEDLFVSCGFNKQGALTISEALRVMALTHHPTGDFPLSFLDIFLEGLTDINRKLFFSVGMCWDLAELMIPDDAPTGPGIGWDEGQFLDNYLRFLVEQSLAHLDYSDVMIDIIDRQMFPTLLAPLTSRGRELKNLCRSLGASNDPYEITEATVGIVNPFINVHRTYANIAVSRKIVEHFNTHNGN
jgi:hypothetical protein